MNDKVQFYTVKPVEIAINYAIKATFYYRIGIVLLATLMIAMIALKVWDMSPAGDKLKNIATIFTCGSIIIGIFYSILNYEYTQIRYKKENKTSRDILSFNVALEFQRATMTEHYYRARDFYLQHKHLLLAGNAAAFEKELIKPENDQAYKSTISMLNFLESISLGVLQGIMDEEFIRGFFSSVFKSQYNTYIVFVEYRRREKQNPKIWNNFTSLALKWSNHSA